MHYRRARITGACYFFTVNIEDRKSRILIDHIGELRDSIRRVKRKHPFHIEAIVIMPDHIHAIWTLPQGESNFSTRWNLIKSGFVGWGEVRTPTLNLPKGEYVSSSRSKKGERGIWQRRFWEHMIRDDHDFGSYVDYIHYNLVKHGYVDKPVDWPYSSMHRYISNGIVDADWACGDRFDEGGFGER